MKMKMKTKKTTSINERLKEAPVPCSRGAPLGQTNNVGSSVEKLHLQKVRIDGGGYAPDGTYWGSGHRPLYCAFNDEGTCIYIRAHTRGLARRTLSDKFKGSTFLRS